MKEKGKEKALEDLKVIKAVMEVANQTMARAGIPTILFGGMIAIPYCPGYEHLIQGLTFGLGMILTGCFMHRRWLRLRREEKSIDVAGSPVDVENKN